MGDFNPAGENGDSPCLLSFIVLASCFYQCHPDNAFTWLQLIPTPAMTPAWRFSRSHHTSVEAPMVPSIWYPLLRGLGGPHSSGLFL